MFTPLKTEIDSRFAAIDSFFKDASKLHGDSGAIAKGLTFVQLYAVYEYTVKNVIQISIDSINAHQHMIKELSPNLLTLYLSAEFESLRDSNKKKHWDARLKIFEQAFSKAKVSLSNSTSPPHSGEHYRHHDLLMIFKVFGIRRLPVRRRSHYNRIDEIVDHRNQIAHGSDTATDVGRRYTNSDIQHRIRQMKSVCDLLVIVFTDYCSKPKLHKR